MNLATKCCSGWRHLTPKIIRALRLRTDPCVLMIASYASVGKGYRSLQLPKLWNPCPVRKVVSIGS
jgi:hypothetical protein